MAEYIEREDAREEFRYHFDEEYADKCVDRLQAADVAPVRHGYWIENQPYTIKRKHMTMSGNAPKCSECGYLSFTGFEQHTRYCPNCGAKMDKEV